MMNFISDHPIYAALIFLAVAEFTRNAFRTWGRNRPCRHGDPTCTYGQCNKCREDTY